MQHGKENITLSRHNVNPDDVMKGITRGTSLQVYGIERKKARNTKREQEATIRAWEEESQEKPGAKANLEDYVALSTRQEETEENEANVEIVEEIVIDIGSSLLCCFRKNNPLVHF